MTFAEAGQQPEPIVAGTAQVRRTRARAAIVMLVASLGIGLLLGRASIWVVPLGTQIVSVLDRQPPVGASVGAQRLKEPAAPVQLDNALLDRSSTVVSRALVPNLGAVEPHSNKACGDPLDASATGFGVLSRPTVMPPSTERTRPDVAILNPGYADADRDVQETAPSRPETVDSSPEYWLNRAEEARRQAADMTHRAAKRQMLNIAEAYWRLAQQAKDEAVDKKTRRRRRG